jgi:hypothetical protein
MTTALPVFIGHIRTVASFHNRGGRMAGSSREFTRHRCTQSEGIDSVLLALALAQSLSASRPLYGLAHRPPMVKVVVSRTHCERLPPEADFNLEAYTDLSNCSVFELDIFSNSPGRSSGITSPARAISLGDYTLHHLSPTDCSHAPQTPRNPRNALSLILGSQGDKRQHTRVFHPAICGKLARGLTQTPSRPR